MSCELCRSELEDFLYGELSESRASEIRAHLAGCGACASARDDLERESELFARYYEQTAIEPSAEMWGAIRERIRAEAVTSQKQLSHDQPSHKQEDAGGWFSGWAGSGAFAWLFRPSILRQAAFSLLLIALTVAVTTWVLKRGKEENRIVEKKETPAPSQPPQAVTPPLPVPSPKGSQKATRRLAPPVKRLSDQGLINQQIGQQIARAEREYRNAIRLLDSAIAKRKEGFDPELIRQYESSLALIDSSIAASRSALRERPNDLAAGQFLLAAYARKVELMQDFSMR
jgi:Putative zinc-finger